MQRWLFSVEDARKALPSTFRCSRRAGSLVTSALAFSGAMWVLHDKDLVVLECTMASRRILLILRLTKAPVSVYKRDAHCRHANLGRLRTRRKAYLLRLHLFGSSQTSTIHSIQSWNGNGTVLNISGSSSTTTPPCCHPGVFEQDGVVE